MPITINIAGDNATEALHELQTLAGGFAKPTVSERLVARVGSDKAGELAVSNKSLDELAAIADAPEQAETPAHREFGKAPEGKTRRTKEEIAEDERVEELANKLGLDDPAKLNFAELGHAGVIELMEAELRQKDYEAKTGQSDARSITDSPEDRKDPENPEDAEQDAADEKAEVDAARDPEAPLTIDDLKSAMNEFVEAKGMPTTQKEGPGIFEKALGKPPAGETAWKLSLLSDATQDQLKAAIAAWKEAANG